MQLQKPIVATAIDLFEFAVPLTFEYDLSGSVIINEKNAVQLSGKQIRTEQELIRNFNTELEDYNITLKINKGKTEIVLSDNTIVKLPLRLARTLGFADTTVRNTMISPLKIDLDRNFSVLKVTCNFSNPCIAHFEQRQRDLCLLSYNDGKMLRNFNSVYGIPAVSQEICELKFRILDIFGIDVPFISGTACASINFLSEN